MKKKILLGLFTMIIITNAVFIQANTQSFHHLMFSPLNDYSFMIEDLLGDGEADDVINWINIKEAIDGYISDLQYNNNAQRIAVLDTGFDKPTWDEYLGKSYGDSLNIWLYDQSGALIATSFETTEAYDGALSLHHGTVIMSTLIQILECGNSPIDVGISMFMSGYPVNVTSVKNHLQFIINWNYAHPDTGKYKIISMSIAQNLNNFANEIEELVNDQDCIVVAASGNQDSATSLLTKAEAHLIENERKYPAGDRHVIGVGGFYGYKGNPDFPTYRMSAYTGLTVEKIGPSGEVTSYFFGSKYWQDAGNSLATVHVSAPAYKVDVIADFNNDGQITRDDKLPATGTSIAAPQVAAAAYLASRLKYELDGYDSLTYSDFFDSLMATCENDQAAKGKSEWQRITWDEVDEPITDNFDDQGIYLFYSRRVGFGSLDVYDLLTSLITLS